jgi:hypothetical protein
MDQNDNIGGTGGSTGGLGGSTGGTGGLGGSTGSVGGNTGSTAGSTGSAASTGGSASGTGSVGSGFGSHQGAAGGADDFGTHETVYRGDFEARTDRPETHTYEQARTGYQLGHTAAAQPANQGREFQEVEVELEKTHEGKFAEVREYARQGFEWKTAIGGLALAAGAYWAGKKAFDAISSSREEETHYRTHYESHPARYTVSYPQARTYYVIGYTASRNPEYAGRSFADVEPELRRGFTGRRASSYEAMRDFCRVGYERGTGQKA